MRMGVGWGTGGCPAIREPEETGIDFCPGATAGVRNKSVPVFAKMLLISLKKAILTEMSNIFELTCRPASRI